MAFAEELPPEILAIKGDVAWGEYLSGECVTCHSAQGAEGGIPRIAGRDTEDIVVAMHAYKQNQRVHPIMQMLAGRLSTEEIAALAAYFNTLD
ncbi:c-type cytochrome [Ruegeria discodermiae]|uniref:c-type cytochrome n=1 Tax=Ruegeria discodermiae TaxID=3064389 RepID=UPI002740D0F8|nr:c-type cytochrome [Ruegeria sp. 2205SS24-7]